MHSTARRPAGGTHTGRSSKSVRHRRLQKQAQENKRREEQFVLCEHVNERGIPEYDPIKDVHAKYCESRSFQKHLKTTRALSPEHMHILESRIRQREEADAVIAAAAGAWSALSSS